MKIINTYIAYLTLRESEWDEETENPDSFDLKHFQSLLGDLGGIDKFKNMRHGIQPSLYHIYIKNALGDYMGRPESRNNKSRPSIGFDDFKRDLPELKKKLKFVQKIKDKLPDYFYSQINKGDDEPATGDAGGMG